jgi:hypothetical protein
LEQALGTKAFQKWNGTKFSGKFLMSVFEVVATGVSQNIEVIDSLSDPKSYVIGQCKALWSNEVFLHNNGAGVRGTTRLSKLLPMSKDFFKP